MTTVPILFIINPISGHINKKNIVKNIEEELDLTKYEHKIVYTEYAGHAGELTRKAVEENYHIIVAVGGDGTINEVARNLINTTSALGIIPCGSGNGLARHLRIPMHPREAIHLLNKGIIHCLDYGMINEHPFFCTCGIGFDAVISERFAKSKARGPKSYIENVLREGFSYHPETYTIINAENKSSYQAFLIAAANASQYGNNAYIAPHASMKDGLLDVIIMKPFRKYDIPQIIFQLFNRKLYKNSHILRIQTSAVKILREKPGVIHCDGDPFPSGTEVDIKIIPSSFNVVVNADVRTRTNVLQLLSEDAEEWWNMQQEIILQQQKKLRLVNKKLKKMFSNKH